MAAVMEKVTIAGVNPYRPIFRIADSSPLTLHSFAMAPARMMALARNPPRSIMGPRSTFFILPSTDWYVFMRPVSCYRHDLHDNTAETIFLRELFGKSPRPAGLTVGIKMKGEPTFIASRRLGHDFFASLSPVLGNSLFSV